MLDLMRMFRIDEKLVPELTLRYKAVNIGASMLSLLGGSPYLTTVSVALAGIVTLLLPKPY